ncbi:hypothetical protein Taro_056231, partial [Colocasia esculenta]|nr:hypothetical protein [Colocasia esculenta]
ANVLSGVLLRASVLLALFEARRLSCAFLPGGSLGEILCKGGWDVASATAGGRGGSLPPCPMQQPLPFAWGHQKKAVGPFLPPLPLTPFALSLPELSLWFALSLPERSLAFALSLCRSLSLSLSLGGSCAAAALLAAGGGFLLPRRATLRRPLPRARARRTSYAVQSRATVAACGRELHRHSCRQRVLPSR